MIAARNSAVAQSKPEPPPTPSLEAIAQLIGVNLESEPELTHIVSEMRTTPLPPTWTIEEIVADQPTSPRASRFTTTGSSISSHTADSEASLSASAMAPKLEYVNRVTRERTCTHPGTPYFLRAVERERISNQRQRRGEVVVVSGTSPKANNSSHNSIIDTMDWSFPSTTAHPEEYGEAGRAGAPSVSTIHDDTATMDDEQPVASTTDSGTNNSSKVRVVRREKPEAGGGTVATSSLAEEDQDKGTERGSTHRKRAPSSGGKGGKRRTSPPKWLVFTSWWHETTSGTENTVNRKHASIRYATANGSLEVELEDVPAIFEVSHATGRYGKVGTVDIRVGAQLSILGRQMRLMQARSYGRLPHT
ncbi:unnamed protein product [Ectocarpus fasciculatus]